MNIEDKIIHYLKKNQSQNRIKHTLSAKKCAVRLAKRYHLNVEKAKMAALLHDCAKWMDDGMLIENARQYGVKLDTMHLDNPLLLHGAAGANIAKKKFGIKDKEILDAICYHTIPNYKMSELSKLIYVADLIEDRRKHDYADEIRKSLDKGLDEIFFMALKKIIVYHIESNKPLHSDSIDSYNNIIKSNNK